MSEGRYRDEPQNLVDQINEMQRRLSALEQNPGLSGSTTGAVSMFAGGTSNIPSGYLLCDGAAVSRITFARLFSAIGTTWGAGDGSTTFNLPNLIDKWLVGAGNLYALASAVGAVNHTHGFSATHTHGHSATHTHGHSATHTHGHSTSHTHTSAGTDSGGSHAHSIPAGTDNVFGATNGAINVSAQAHTHGGTNSGGSHSHSVSGSTGSSTPGTSDAASPGTSDSASPGTSDSGSNLPPSAALVPIIRF